MPIPFETRGPGKGPPANVPPTELFRKLMDSRRPHEVMPWIRNDEDGKPLGEFAMIVLTQEEQDNCVANAENYVTRKFDQRYKGTDGKPNQEAWREMFETACAVELVYCACKDKDDLSKPLFLSPDDIRQYLTVDEIAMLVNSYEVLQRKFGPMWRELTDEEIDCWIDTLAKGAACYPLGGLSAGQLAQLTVSLARRLQRLLTDNSSLGSQSDDAPNDSESNSTPVE